MNLLMQILYLSSFITPILAPFLYKSKRPVMIDLYRRMTVSKSFRKLYSHVLTLYLLAFHFYYLSLFNHPSWLIPSTILTMLTYSHTFCEKIFNLIQNKRVLLVCVTAAILCLLVPAFLPLGFTVLVISVAAMFYPSHLLRNELSSIAEKRQMWLDNPDAAVLKYFRWDLMEGNCIRRKRPMVVEEILPIIEQLNALDRDDSYSHKSFRIHPDAIEDAEFTEIEN